MTHKVLTQFQYSGLRAEKKTIIKLSDHFKLPVLQLLDCNLYINIVNGNPCAVSKLRTSLNSTLNLWYNFPVRIRGRMKDENGRSIFST